MAGADGKGEYAAVEKKEKVIFILSTNNVYCANNFQIKTKKNAADRGDGGGVRGVEEDLGTGSRMYDHCRIYHWVWDLHM